MARISLRKYVEYFLALLPDLHTYHLNVVTPVNMLRPGYDDRRL